MELDTKQKGNLTEVQCLVFFIKNGYEVSIPYGENTRYDLILDYNNKLLKIQCKTCRVCRGTEERPETLSFNCCSTRSNSSGAKRVYYTKDEIDYFATVFKDQIYLIPVEECGAEKQLRLIAPANNQRIGISFAEDYEALKILERRE